MKTSIRTVRFGGLNLYKRTLEVQRFSEFLRFEVKKELRRATFSFSFLNLKFQNKFSLLLLRVFEGNFNKIFIKVKKKLLGENYIKS